MEVALTILPGAVIAATLLARSRLLAGQRAEPAGESRAMQDTLHAAASALAHLRDGLAPNAATRAAPHLRALVQAPALQLTGPDGPLAFAGDERAARTGAAVEAPLLVRGERVGALRAYYAGVAPGSGRERQMVEEAASLVSAQLALAGLDEPGEGDRKPPQDAEVLPVASRRGATRLVRRDAILYLQARGDYVRIVAEDGRFLTRARISDLERRWERHGFVRVHRGYVVNLRRAIEVRPQLNGTAVLAFPGELEVPVARRKVADLRERLAR